MVHAGQGAVGKLLIVEDEPLILIDLEYAAEDHGCEPLGAQDCAEALALIARHGTSLTAAILDVSLGAGETCVPVARELERLGVPFLLHSGDLDRHEEKIRTLSAPLVAKPVPSDQVIAAALSLAASGDDDAVQAAAG
ncbi:MAG: response regulator [Erythrobacter sp.]|jgi:DNA-binding response OmpR family regulator|nr:response regulator [Erythrobacter sp.]